jgi:hypothetical protein
MQWSSSRSRFGLRAGLFVDGGGSAKRDFVS